MSGGCEHNNLWTCDRCMRDQDHRLIDKLRTEIADLREIAKYAALTMESDIGYGDYSVACINLVLALKGYK